MFTGNHAESWVAADESTRMEERGALDNKILKERRERLIWISTSLAEFDCPCEACNPRAQQLHEQNLLGALYSRLSSTRWVLDVMMWSPPLDVEVPPSCMASL
jgi:hypothetical protein